MGRLSTRFERNTQVASERRPFADWSIGVFPLSIFLTLHLSTPVLAHSVGQRFGDFYGGMFHPLASLNHLLSFIALGLLAGQQPPKVARWVLIALPLGLILGSQLVAWNPFPSILPYVNHASLVLLGILVVCAWRMPPPLLTLIGLLVGVTHGYENSIGVNSEVAWHLHVLGTASAGLLVVGVVAATIVSPRVAWQRIAVRVAGSWTTAIGILTLGLV